MANYWPRIDAFTALRLLGLNVYVPLRPHRRCAQLDTIARRCAFLREIGYETRQVSSLDGFCVLSTPAVIKDIKAGSSAHIL
jgi:hypothetical protein